MDLPTIDGRECVPVRLLPFITAWQTLSPDVVARLFSRREEWRTWSISTYNLRPNGKHHELLPNAWDQTNDDLTVLAQELKTQESFEFQKYPEWRRRSVKLLPAAVFVWRDELVAEYARTYGRQPYPSLRPGAGGCTEEEAEAECENIIRLCRNPDTSEEADAAIEKFQQSVERDTVYRPGDGVLNFEPLLSADDEMVAFEGFESVMSEGSRTTSPQRAKQEQDIQDAIGARQDIPTATTGVSIGTLTHSTKTRGRDTLDPVIEFAQSKCVDRSDTAQVWAQMEVLAQSEHAPLLAATADGLKYTKNGGSTYFTRDALDKRLHPEKRQGAAGRRQPPLTAADRR